MPSMSHTKPNWWVVHQRKVIPYLFITPTMLIFLTFVFVPIAYAAFMSFTKWNGISQPEFIGIKNYKDLLSDPVFWVSLRNTLVYALGVVPHGCGWHRSDWEVVWWGVEAVKLEQMSSAEVLVSIIIFVCCNAS